MALFSSKGRALAVAVLICAGVTSVARAGQASARLRRVAASTSRVFMSNPGSRWLPELPPLAPEYRGEGRYETTAVRLNYRRFRRAGHFSIVPCARAFARELSQVLARATP